MPGGALNKYNQRLPTALDTIVFDINHSNENSTQDILNNVTIAGLQIGNRYGGTITVPSSLTVTNLDFNSGAKLSGNGSLFIAGKGSMWSAGTIQLCSTTVETNASLDIETHAVGVMSTVTLNTSLFNNAGTVNYDDSVMMTLQSASFVNQQNSFFDAQDGAGQACSLTGNAGGGSTFIQQNGSELKLDNSFTIDANVAVQLSGTISSTAGGFGANVLTLTAASDLDGAVVKSVGVKLSLGGGVVHKWNSVNVQAGMVVAPNATVQLTGTNNLGGRFDLVNTTLSGGPSPLLLEVYCGFRTERSTASPLRSRPTVKLISSIRRTTNRSP